MNAPMPFQAVFDSFAKLRQERTHFARVREQFLASPTPELGQQYAASASAPAAADAYEAIAAYYDASVRRLSDNIVELIDRATEYHNEIGEILRADLLRVHHPTSFVGSIR